MKGDHTATLHQKIQQHRDVAEPDKYLGMAGDGIHVQQRQDARGPVSPAGTDDAVNVGIGKQVVQQVRPVLVRAGQVAVLIEYSLRNDKVEIHGFQDPQASIE